MTHPMPQRGFTLIETMVAITVLAIALVGPFVAVRSALTGSYTARDQLIASALAQEGLEYVRSVRDNNYLNGDRGWMDGLSSLACYGANPTSYCTVDPTQGDPHNSGSDAIAAYNSVSPGDCSAGARCLYLSSTGLYNQQLEGTETRFKRVVQIRHISANEVVVSAQVHWTTNGRPYSITVTDVLRDWI